METLGNHILLDLWGIASERLDDDRALHESFVAAAERGGAHVVDARFCRFAPHGISGVVILAESHLTVHTWPEHGYAAVDVFTCGAAEVGERIVDEILTSLQPLRHELRRLRRGLPRGNSLAQPTEAATTAQGAAEATG